MKTVLVIAYMMSGHVIDTETLEASNMAECQNTKRVALTGTTPVTTRYGSDVQIHAECKQLNQSADLIPPTSVF